MTENDQNRQNKQKYSDEKGRVYIIERLACCAAVGKISQNVHILYEDGKRAVIPFDIHRQHSKLEDSAQSPPSGTNDDLKVVPSTKSHWPEGPALPYDESKALEQEENDGQ